MATSWRRRRPGSAAAPGTVAGRHLTRAAAVRLLEVEGDRHRRMGRPGVLRVDLPLGHVAHVVLHDAHAHEGRRLTHRADAPGLLDNDLPDLLARLDPLFFLHAEGVAEEIH